MIINPYLVAPSVTYDPDAQAFITASGISGSNATSINNLVINLKAAGLWTKMKAIYPFVGGTSSTHKWNLKDPRDLDVAYRLVFSGGWTHSSNGILPNGANTYANPFINTATVLTNNSSHVSFYSRTDVAQNSVDWGVQIPAVSELTLYTKWSDNNLYSDQYNSSTNRIIYSNSSSTGFYISNRSSSTVFKVHKNGSVVGTNNNASSPSITNQNIVISALNTQGSGISLYSTRQCAFASIGDGLSDLESQVFNQIVEGYQYSLGRNINPAQSFYYNTSYNNETNAFLYSTQVTDPVTQGAVNTLVNDMKTYGVWSKMKAIYPIVGGSASSHAVNLKTPGTYNLSFSTGWTHASTGMTPNGSAYANTSFIPNNNLTDSNNHQSFYSRTNSSAANICEIGSYDGSFRFFGMQLKFTGDLFLCANGINPYPTASNTNSQGFYLMTKNSSTSLNAYKNSSKVITNGTTGSGISTTNVWIGAFNANGTGANYSTKECAFASMGDVLTDTDASNFRYAVEKLQTTLGRSVSTNYPTVSDTDAQSFINTANITDTTQANAINDLVIGLKADGLWTKMKAVYPMVGGSATSHAINLKTQSQYNLTFAGGWTHSSTGAKPNGTNSYANTSIVPSTHLSLNSTHLSYYATTAGIPASYGITMGSVVNIGDYAFTYIGTESNGYFYPLISSGTTGGTNLFYTPSRYNSLMIGNRISSGSQDGWANNVKTSLPRSSYALNAAALYIGARNFGGTIDNYGTNECRFASIGDGLTDTDATNLYSRVQTFQTTLGRQV